MTFNARPELGLLSGAVHPNSHRNAFITRLNAGWILCAPGVRDAPICCEDHRCTLYVENQFRWLARKSSARGLRLRRSETWKPSFGNVAEPIAHRQRQLAEAAIIISFACRSA